MQYRIFRHSFLKHLAFSYLSSYSFKNLYTGWKHVEVDWCAVSLSYTALRKKLWPINSSAIFCTTRYTYISIRSVIMINAVVHYYTLSFCTCLRSIWGSDTSDNLILPSDTSWLSNHLLNMSALVWYDCHFTSTSYKWVKCTTIIMVQQLTTHK